MKDCTPKNIGISSEDVHSYLKMLNMIHKVSGVKYMKEKFIYKICPICKKQYKFRNGFEVNNLICTSENCRNKN